MTKENKNYKKSMIGYKKAMENHIIGITRSHKDDELRILSLKAELKYLVNKRSQYFYPELKNTKQIIKDTEKIIKNIK